MSHQSGIQVSKPLAEAFANAVKNDNVRILKVSIKDESLVEDGTLPVQGTAEQDFAKVTTFFEDKIPAYLLFRLDENTSQGYSWAFMCYVPDNAKVREKMLYAATRSTLTKTLGDYRFVDELYGTELSDFTYEAFLKHRQSKQAAPPLTEREEEKARMRKEEAGADIGLTTKKAHVHGVSFPVAQDAQDKLQQLANGSLNYVQLSIDVSGETILLETAKNLDARDILAATPTDRPRYHFFRYRHAFEDNTIEQTIFIYSCPLASKVKERMLYSSCKSAVVQVADSIGLTIEKSSEIGDVDELTETFIFEELHPKKAEEKKAFKKPTKPGRAPTTRPTRGAAGGNDNED